MTSYRYVTPLLPVSTRPHNGCSGCVLINAHSLSTWVIGGSTPITKVRWKKTRQKKILNLFCASIAKRRMRYTNVPIVTRPVNDRFLLPTEFSVSFVCSKHNWLAGCFILLVDEPMKFCEQCAAVVHQGKLARVHRYVPIVTLQQVKAWHQISLVLIS